jgi:hypothetical protein
MHLRKYMSRDHHPPLCDVTADMKNSVLDRVYRAVAWQRVDQIRYNMFPEYINPLIYPQIYGGLITIVFAVSVFRY